jgi:hypothetical protein
VKAVQTFLAFKQFLAVLEPSLIGQFAHVCHVFKQKPVLEAPFGTRLAATAFNVFKQSLAFKEPPGTRLLVDAFQFQQLQLHAFKPLFALLGPTGIKDDAAALPTDSKSSERFSWM